MCANAAVALLDDWRTLLNEAVSMCANARIALLDDTCDRHASTVE